MCFHPAGLLGTPGGGAHLGKRSQEEADEGQALMISSRHSPQIEAASLCPDHINIEQGCLEDLRSLKELEGRG